MTRGRWPLTLWTVLIALAVVPWANYQHHSHWQRIGWIPFGSPEVRLRDIILNVLLYAPWGYFCARSLRDGAGRIWLVIGFAAALSITTEASQLYSHGRFPSATDVASNMLGAYAGAILARRLN
jgi:glycopeptide antibiotics resistance protein